MLVDVLLETFGHDNTPFLDALKQRGFHVVEDAHSNYPKTQMSLASSMNLDYLDPEQLKAEWDEALPNFVAQIWDNKVMDVLAGYGYEFPTFSSGVAATEINACQWGGVGMCTISMSLRSSTSRKSA